MCLLGRQLCAPIKLALPASAPIVSFISYSPETWLLAKCMPYKHFQVIRVATCRSVLVCHLPKQKAEASSSAANIAFITDEVDMFTSVVPVCSLVNLSVPAGNMTGVEVS